MSGKEKIYVNRLLVFVIAVACPAAAVAQEIGDRHPVYVGGGVCASCHQGAGMLHQFSLWLASGHARAFAVLAKPEAKKIAELSGITQEPQESPMCLGCHTTGAHVEQWEKDETFSTLDGVQCEKCHGPGSEYMDERIMMDAEASKKAGLVIPTVRDCMGCHQAKGSHVAVHNLPALDMAEAMAQIAHPTPANFRFDSIIELPDRETAEQTKHKYIGTLTCAECHKGSEMGYHVSKWRLSAHANAYAVLASEQAQKIAKDEGLTADPQKSTE